MNGAVARAKASTRDEMGRWVMAASYTIARGRVYVIPADRKWFRNLAIGQLLHQALTDLDPQWPVAEFDVEAEKKRLAEEKPVS